MSGSTENRASGSSARSSRRDTVLTWTAASRMLPLVRHIVDDVLASQRRLNQMSHEKDRLDRQRRDLAWPERARRYQLDEELASEERRLRDALGELDGLGLTLFDRQLGQVGFPTTVNRQRAYFTWQPGEETLNFWQTGQDEERRPIPASWKKTETRTRK